MTGIDIMRRVLGVQATGQQLRSGRAGALWDNYPCRKGTCWYLPVETGQYVCLGVCGQI